MVVIKNVTKSYDVCQICKKNIVDRTNIVIINGKIFHFDCYNSLSQKEINKLCSENGK
jgi:hypothetical protein